jgi:hypothetical protein
LIRVCIEGVGLAGPGLAGWPESRRVLAGVEAYTQTPTVIPAPVLLPAAEGRRTVRSVRLALAVAHEAFTHAARDAAATATVFASSGGDGDTVHAILEILASAEREVSPTRFHNSVHNVASGYWSIAARSHEPSTSVCAFDASFAAGLLDAATQASVEGRAVALVAYDHPYPEPLQATRPLAASFGVALVLAPEATSNAVAALEVEIAAAGEATRVADASLEALRTGVPAARSVPLLAALAREAAAVVDLEYIGGACLRVKVAPCR